jgi:hypothetical protein
MKCGLNARKQKKIIKKLPSFVDGQHLAKLGLFYQHGPALSRAGLALDKLTRALPSASRRQSLFLFKKIKKRKKFFADGLPCRPSAKNFF